MIPHASPRRFWETRASALARRINLAAWLARVAPATFFVASAFAVAVYALRRVESPLTLAWAALATALLLVAVLCWWRARAAFFSAADSRVLLESHLRLETRLTAASLGLLPWPDVPRELPAVLQWRLRAPFGWLAAALALTWAAAYAPVPRETQRAPVSGSPPALLQTQEMLAALKETNLPEPQAIEQLEERARELARRPTDEQYSHSALEAADALRNQTIVSTANLARSLDSAADALRAANDSPDLSGPAGQLAAALAGMRESTLPANKDLLANLPASASDLRNLSPGQRAQLAQQLAKAAKGLNGIRGAAGAGAQVAQPDAEGVLQPGGTGGGGENAPLMLAGNQSDTGQGNAEALTAGDLKRFSLGDKLGMTTGAHDVDPNKSVDPTSAGAIAAPASGGEAAWVNRLTPTERAALKNFFK